MAGAVVEMPHDGNGVQAQAASGVVVQTCPGGHAPPHRPAD
jgi:hypothetical protein